MLPLLRSLLLPAFIVALLLTPGCRSDDDDTRRLDASDDGTTVELAVGDEVVIALESNPTTGFEWKIAALNLAVVSEGEREYTSDNPDTEGGGGTAELHFEAVAPGETTLELDYTGPSSPDDITDRYSVTFVVADD